MKEEKMPFIMKHIVWLNLVWQWRYLTDIKSGFLFIGTHCILFSVLTLRFYFLLLRLPIAIILVLIFPHEKVHSRGLADKNAKYANEVFTKIAKLQFVSFRLKIDVRINKKYIVILINCVHFYNCRVWFNSNKKNNDDFKNLKEQSCRRY